MGAETRAWVSAGAATRGASAAHRALDGLLLLRRQRDGRLAAFELLHVDPRVVAALDGRDDHAGPRRVAPRARGRLVPARVLVGVVADDRRVGDGRVDAAVDAGEAALDLVDRAV